MSVPQFYPPSRPHQTPLDRVKSRQRKVLVVDDEPLMLTSLFRTLRRLDVVCELAEDGPAALRLLEGGLDPDVMLTDQRMPGMTGAELLREARVRWPEVIRVCMSGYADKPEILDAINEGNIYRFLPKPWEHGQLEDTVQDALGQADLVRENEALRATIQAQNHDLKETNAELQEGLLERTAALMQQTERLDDLLLETVRALAVTIEAKDTYTAGHSELVSRFSVALGREIGLSHDELECLRLGGVLHDIGKIAVPDTVLLKPGRLTPEEFEEVKAHPVVGYRILQDLRFGHDLLPIVRSHHERWDGRGYPDRLVGEQTPLLARVTHVVDVYEAITARRVYREPMPEEKVVELFERGRGTDFDPELVTPFLELLEDGVFERIRARAGLDVAQEIGTFTFKEPPRVELRED